MEIFYILVAIGLVVIFWKALLRDPSSLANAVEKRLGVSKAEFISIQDGFRNRYEKLSKVRCASTFYLLNRTSYSGTTLSGGMAIDNDKTKRWERRNPRFNLASIERLRNFSVKNLTVSMRDFEVSIGKHKDALIYADPPYYVGKKNLYGNQGDMHFTQDDHERLAKILKRRKCWILSYNDVPEVRELYREFMKRKIKMSWSYGMSDVKSRQKKHSNEILICSKDIKIQRQSKVS